MIRLCTTLEFDEIWAIINDGAQAYRGAIPADRVPDPYMSREKLQQEMDAGVVFWGYHDGRCLLGVMGIQAIQHPIQDVTLIRHAYVLTSSQRLGIGAQLLAHLRPLAADPVLIGTWADAVWAVRFYQRHGFRMVPPDEKERLLKRYWSVPERQIETSVVLADEQWWTLNAPRVAGAPLPAVLR